MKDIKFMLERFKGGMGVLCENSDEVEQLKELLENDGAGIISYSEEDSMFTFPAIFYYEEEPYPTAIPEGIKAPIDTPFGKMDVDSRYRNISINIKNSLADTVAFPEFLALYPMCQIIPCQKIITRDGAMYVAIIGWEGGIHFIPYDYQKDRQNFLNLKDYGDKFYHKSSNRGKDIMKVISANYPDMMVPEIGSNTVLWDRNNYNNNAIPVIKTSQLLSMASFDTTSVKLVDDVNIATLIVQEEPPVVG